jgi:hypothetical protein
VCVWGGGVGGAVGLKQEVILRSSKNVTTEVGPPTDFSNSREFRVLELEEEFSSIY